MLTWMKWHIHSRKYTLGKEHLNACLGRQACSVRIQCELVQLAFGLCVQRIAPRIMQELSSMLSGRPGRNSTSTARGTPSGSGVWMHARAAGLTAGKCLE